MATFAESFRAHVVPRLRERCTVQGMYLAHGLVDWWEAFDDVQQTAIARGALHLPMDDWWGLLDWIGTQLTEAVERSEQVARQGLEVRRAA